MIRHLYSAAWYLAEKLLPRCRPLLSDKGRRWVEGIQRSSALLQQCPSHAHVWIHCASLGEYEQAAPLIDALQARLPQRRILLTFFSPSGYEKLKSRRDITVHYLPPDTPSNMRRWIAHWRPRYAFFVRYEFWQNALFSLAAANVPTYLIAGFFRPSQPYFRWAAPFYRPIFRAFSGFFVQDETSAHTLRQFGISRVWTVGDPRIDRMAGFAPDEAVVARIRSFLPPERPVLIGGSTYPPEEAILQKVHARFPEVTLIIAPHEVSPRRIHAIQQRFPDARRWSENTPAPTSVLILDQVGLLKSAYYAADIAFIGGGFHARIHNVLEPAAAGLPIFFGPRHHDFPEAQALIHQGAAFAIHNAHDMIRQIQPLLDAAHRTRIGQKARTWIDAHRGATRRIIQQLEKEGLFDHL